MDDKLFFIDAYFKTWEKKMDNVAKLLANENYYLEVILILSCYLGAFAALRYPNNKKDRDAYIKIVLGYSGKRSFFEQIDLLYFYGWKKSISRNDKTLKKLQKYDEIVAALTNEYGDENKIETKTRFISPSVFLEVVKAANIPKFNEQNLSSKLPFFSLAESLYRFVRCPAVHEADFPLIGQAVNADGDTIYRETHPITGKVMLETTQAVCQRLGDECRAKNKWPDEL